MGWDAGMTPRGRHGWPALVAGSCSARDPGYSKSFTVHNWSWRCPACLTALATRSKLPKSCAHPCRREAERQERLARAAAYEEAAWVRGEAGSGSEEEDEEVRITADFFWRGC